MRISVKKVLFIDTTHPVIREELEKAGYVCDYFSGYTRADYEKCIHEYEGVIIRSKIELDKPILDKAINLKFIGRVGAGMESIDVAYAEMKGIRCYNSPEGNRIAVGEHAVGLLLALMNKIIPASSGIKRGVWEREGNRGIEICKKTIGIIGYGNMGSAFAQCISGFGAKVLAYDKYKTGFSSTLVQESNLDNLFEQCDILSLHVPLTQETHYMVDDAFLQKFKKPLFLINTARGQVVKTLDLVKNLQQGKVLGAGLDVLEYESFSFESMNLQQIPADFDYLLHADNVILTPHIAGWTVESKYKLSKVLVDKILEER